MPMKRLYSLALLLLVGACHPDASTPNRQRDAKDAVSVDLRHNWCFENGQVSVEHPAMQPSRRFKGVWHWGFEYSEFEEEGHPAPSSEVLGVWLEVANPERFSLGDFPITQHYAIEFIGRESVCDRDAMPIGMGFGHFGASQRLVVADRIVSIKPVKPPQSRGP